MFIEPGVGSIRSLVRGGMLNISFLSELRSRLKRDFYKHSAPERNQMSGFWDRLREPTPQIMRSFVAICRIFVVGLAFLLSMSCGRSERPRASGPGVVRNPIEDMLRISHPVARQEGIAAAILVDTSGSMADSVPDASGGPRPKIAIAKDAVLRLVRQFEEYARQHADRHILLGIYEFSAREHQPFCRQVVPLASPDVATTEKAVQKMRPQGGTPIGNAMIVAKQDLDMSGFSRRHILVVTDGENTRGYAPGDVAAVINRQKEEERAGIYFVAFDVAAQNFNTVRDAGGLVLAASNERDLRETLDYVLTGKILAEQPVSIPKQ